MKVMEAPGVRDARVPVWQTGESVAQRYKFHRPPADQHLPRHILNTGFCIRVREPGLGLSSPVGRAPGRLRSPDGAPSDLISPPLCISPQKPPPPLHPPRLHLGLRWRHIDSKLTTANQVRVNAQRDVTRKLERFGPDRLYNSYCTIKYFFLRSHCFL